MAADGNWILFTSNRDGNQEIYRIHPDGSGAENLTRHPADDFSATVSRNLDHIWHKSWLLVVGVLGIVVGAWRVRR